MERRLIPNTEGLTEEEIGRHYTALHTVTFGDDVPEDRRIAFLQRLAPMSQMIAVN